jgi:hypothetical protein
MAMASLTPRNGVENIHSCLVNNVTNPNSNEYNEYKLTAIVLDIAGHTLNRQTFLSETVVCQQRY